MPQIRLGSGEEPAPMTDHLQVVPCLEVATVLVELENRRAGERSQQRRVGGQQELRSVR